MKKMVLYAVVLSLLSGCAASKINMPTMGLPQAPTKPAIKSVTVQKGNDFLVAYTVPDALRLYQYLLEQDAYAEKLEYRIKAMNQLWQGSK
jgi:hypothetical protein